MYSHIGGTVLVGVRTLYIVKLQHRLSMHRHLRDNVNALEITMRGEYSNADTDCVGPSYSYFDMWRQQGWELHTHGGFLTYPHHDAAGLCTYMYIRSGAKIWAFIRPQLHEYQSRPELFARQDQLGIYQNYQSIQPMAVILLEPGELLCVP
jgi:hypothetical protein